MFEFLSNSWLLVAQAKPEDVASLPFYQTGWFMFLMLIATVAIGWFLAQAITKSIRLSEYGGRLAIVLIATLVACLMIWAKWEPGYGPKFGVDLRGGINMVGSLNLDAFSEQDSLNMQRPEAKDIIPALIRRVNPSGTKEIMIRALGSDKIEVTIPSVELQEADEIWDRLVKAGKLEFRIIADSLHDKPAIDLARKLADGGSRDRLVQEVDSSGTKTTVAVWTTLAREVPEDGKSDEDSVAPIKFVPSRGQLVRDKSTGQILEIMDIQSSFGSNPDTHGQDFANWCKAHNVRTPQILVVQPDEDSNVEGKHLSQVRTGTDEKGRACVNFDTTDEGSSRMGMLTKFNEPDASGNLRLMGIVLDGQLHSAPSIQEAIYKNGRISGSFTQKEVDELVINLRSGKLDVALNKAPISKDFINSTLGQELKDKGIWAIASSLILVLVFMVFYYRFAGVVATIGLLLNLILILALVMAINQPLTLTGLAGLVLTVGMSVDANVLIFERIREELDRGAALRMAIRNGFDKATTTIVDANVTTLITAIVLYVIGTEQIKGFAVTLILGILMSMFTAIFVSRLIFDIFERKRWVTKLNMTRIFDRAKFEFINKVAITSLVSISLIVIGLIGMFVLKSRILDHDLRGGSTIRIVFNQAMDIEKIKQTLAEQNLEHDGEKLEFTVTGFLEQTNPELANRQFKVDCNLPAWEGPPAPKFEQLDELMTRIFQGQLLLHHADVVGASTSQAPPVGTKNSETPKTGLKWQAAPSVSAIASTMFLLQDAGAENTSGTSTQDPPQSTDKADEKTQDPKASQTATPDPATATQGAAEQNPAAKGAASQGPAGKDAPIQDTTIQDAVVPAVPEKGGGDAGGDFQEEQAAQVNVNYRNVTRELKVEPRILGATLRALLVEASDRVDRGVDEEQINLDSPDVVPDENPLSTISDTWKVTMNVPEDSDADFIISEWKEKFNSLPYFPTASKVGGQIAGQTQLQAMAAIIASLIGIIAYVWVRFQNVAFGLAAVVALIHDVLIVLGCIALSHWLAGVLGILGIVEFKISLEIVAALLTVIGYSLNDTIVVFDRIREVRGKRTEITAEMINTSISQTLSRTLLTSFTTFIVVFILYCFGGEAIHGFAFSLCVGIVVGTYSSIFIASPVLLWLMNSVGLNPGIVETAEAKLG